jgi:indolepyruvate ferredoxin oxidoreductase beta subunit
MAALMSDIIIAGVGGQGTVLASKLLAQAALSQGRMVRTAETIGMAQRGGSVLGHVRIASPSAPLAGSSSAAQSPTSPSSPSTARPPSAMGRAADTPFSPLVSQGAADLLIGFEPGETVRALGYLRHGGTVVTAMQALEPVTATLTNLSYSGKAELAYLRGCKTNGRIGILVTIDGAALCASLNSTRVLNVVLLGAALATKSLDIPPSAVAQAIETLVRPQLVELNREALARGMNHMEESRI